MSSYRNSHCDGQKGCHSPISIPSTSSTPYIQPSAKRKWRHPKRSPVQRWTRLLVAAPLLLGALALFSWAASYESGNGFVDGAKQGGKSRGEEWLAEDLLLPLHATGNGRFKRNTNNKDSIRVTAEDVVRARAKPSKKVVSTPAPKRRTTSGGTRSSSQRHKKLMAGDVVRRKVLFFELDCKIRNHSLLSTTPTRNPSDIAEDSEDYYYDDEMDDSQFPRDFFSLKQRRNGAVCLHMFGLVYMFIALAIVCDEFFVPALAVITEKLDISEDVAGATFMAAGGSAPEFFTSVIGVFVAQNNVGIGTIVGSATFNILCVLAFCTLFSTTVLQLTWWPLFRDVTFYVTALFMLVIFFLDERIVWWEALSLFIVYLCYASFMRFNANIENLIKSKFGNSVEPLAQEDEEQQAPIMKDTYAEQQSGYSELEQTTEFTNDPTNNNNSSRKTSILANRQHPSHLAQKNSSGSVTGNLQRADSLANNRRRAASQSSLTGAGGRRQSIPILHSGAMFRNGIMQLMSQTLDPLTEGEGPEGETTPTTQQRKFSSACNIKHTPQNGTVIVERQPILSGHRKDENGMPRPDSVRSLSDRRSTKADIEQLKSILEEEEEKPLDMGWPDKWHKQLVFLFLIPILFPLWITIPDVRREESKKWYPLTFLVAIFWIAVFSYLMVWWANTIGETFGIPTEIIGLTILAAGTSIPDLITSVIVARKGLGDMAVSSSVGSNIFDVCVGLPVPWLLFFIVEPLRSGRAVESIAVSSNGLICSVGVLFIMLLLLVAAIGMCGWQMNKLFGVTMIISYVAFCTLSVSLETGRFVCPLRLC